jgi:hypothetical protein
MTAGDRPARLLIVLAGFFICNALIAEFIGVKVFSLEDTLGIDPFNWRLFGQSGSLSFTAGVLVWPIVFIMTDVINEYYGRNGVRFLSFLTVALILYAFLFAYLAIALVPASWWTRVADGAGVPDLQIAFAYIYGQGMWTIAGSVTAFLIGQLIDVAVFRNIRQRTGERFIWLRATASTAVSQLVDSFVVLYIAFVIGPQHWPISLFLAVGTVNYGYKLAAAIFLIPLIYVCRAGIEAYLGAATASRLKAAAAA